MGHGEIWMEDWGRFMATLPDHESKLAYFRRHRPAPYCWGNLVYGYLFRGEKIGLTLTPEQIDRLLSLGLVEADVACATWLSQQDGIAWPWLLRESPEMMARYQIRDFWFWSRQVSELRQLGHLVVPDVPSAWRECSLALQSGQPGELDVRYGLQTMATLLCVGDVRGPWQFGLGVESICQNYEMDMGYSDAFALWCQFVFDDRPHLSQFLEDSNAPGSWTSWCDENLRLAG